MKTIRLFTLGLLALLAASCGKDPVKKDDPNPNPNPVNAGYIELTPWRLGLASGQSQRVTATVYIDGESLADPKIEWESSDPSLATVDQTGLVTATEDYNKEGTAQVTATYGDLTATCDVRVSAPVLVKSLSFDQASVTIPCLGTLQLHPTVLPEDANMFNYQWTSDNTDVATVDQTGLVTAGVNVDTCTVSVTAEGGATASIQIITENPYKMQQASSLKALSGTDVKAQVEVDAQTGEHLLYFRIYDSRTKAFVNDGNEKHFSWTADKPGVANVSLATTDDGGYCHSITCKQAGTTDITLTYQDDNNLQVTCTMTVSVKGNFYSIQQVNNLKALTGTDIKAKVEVDAQSGENILYFRIYDSRTQAFVNDKNEKHFSWTTDNPEVADVSLTTADNGGYCHSINCKKAGTANITLNYYDSDSLQVTGNLTVSVKGSFYSLKQVSSTADQSGTNANAQVEMNAQAGEHTLYFRINDSRTQAFITDKEEKHFSWTVDKPEVAGVSLAATSNGSYCYSVTGKNAGTANITLSYYDSDNNQLTYKLALTVKGSYYTLKQVNSLTDVNGTDVKTSMTVDVHSGEQMLYFRVYDNRLKAFVNDGNSGHFTGSSSNTDAANVSAVPTDNGGYCHAISCKKTGTANVTLTYQDNDNIKVTQNLTVKVNGNNLADNYFIGMGVGSYGSADTWYKNPSEVTTVKGLLYFRMYTKADNSSNYANFKWTVVSDDGDLVVEHERWYARSSSTDWVSGKPNAASAYILGLKLNTAGSKKSSNIVLQIADGGDTVTLNLKVNLAPTSYTIGGVTFTMHNWNPAAREMDDYINYSMGPMGSKVYTNRLSRFGLGTHEVTQKLWTAVMGSNPSSTSLNIGDNYPVNNVSYAMATQFVSRLNKMAAADYPGCTFRLPTESEWEYAASYRARCGDGGLYAGSDMIDRVAWYKGTSGGNIHEVGQKLDNGGGVRTEEGGIYDLSGNVAEWCYDWYADYPTTTQKNYSGPSSGSTKVLRGGCYSSESTECIWYVRKQELLRNADPKYGLRLAVSFAAPMCEGTF